MATTSTTGTEPPPLAAARIRPLVAGLVGFLAIAAALGAGHLVAGLVSARSSPVVAVGDAFIRVTPGLLLEFAKSTFGTADKVVLNLGMVVVIAAVAVAAGLASRRSTRPGRLVMVLLGLVAAAAALSSPVFALVDLLAPAVALVTGLVVFGWLHRLAADAARAAEAAEGAGSGPGAALSRRRLIRSSAGVAAGTVVAGLLGQWRVGAPGIEDSRRAVGPVTAATPAPPIPPGADFAALGTPGFVTPNPAFYRIDTANLAIPQVPAADWSMRIHGMVDREITLDYAALRARRLVEKTITMTCVSNEIGGDLISTANFVGVPLRDLLLEAGVRSGTDQIFTTSTDGWTCGTPVDVVMEPSRGALLAIGMNGEPLPLEHGFPVRMVVPGLYGFVSATKWLADMELTTFDAKQSYWLRRGWGQRAPIKTQSRIDKPKPFERVAPGRVTLAGIAWAQPKGIQRVEVRADNGPWVSAELATEVSYDTWRMWRAELDLGPGSHTVQCRATDRTGFTQVEDRLEPIPDGATGWHTVIFSVG